MNGERFVKVIPVNTMKATINLSKFCSSNFLINHISSDFSTFKVLRYIVLALLEAA